MLLLLLAARVFSFSFLFFFFKRKDQWGAASRTFGIGRAEKKIRLSLQCADNLEYRYLLEYLPYFYRASALLHFATSLLTPGQDTRPIGRREQFGQSRIGTSTTKVTPHCSSRMHFPGKRLGTIPGSFDHWAGLSTCIKTGDCRVGMSRVRTCGSFFHVVVGSPRSLSILWYLIAVQ